MALLKRHRFDETRNKIHVISLSCNTVPPIGYGGIELVVTHLCEGLCALGCKVICYSPGELGIKGVQHWKTLNNPSSGLSGGGVPNTEEHLELILKGLRNNLSTGDVVVFNHAAQFRFLKKRLGFLSSLKYSFCEIAHWNDVGVYKNIIYPSKEVSIEIKKPGVIIPHGVKLLFGDIDTERDNFLFFAGRITKNKGVHIALEAVKKLGVKLVLAGPLHVRDYSIPIIEDEHVEYLGELSYEELFRYYSTCKALVYMTQYAEPFGLSVVEAMAAGSPVITTGKGGTGETVLENITGYFCQTSDDIYSAYHKLNNITSEKCIQRAKEYSVKKMCESYLMFFKNI